MLMSEGVEARITSVSLADQMSRYLGEAIVKNELHEKGAYITEAEIEKRYGTSRIVVREAVKILLGKGLISSRQRRGIQATERHTWNLFDNDILQWMMEFCDAKELHQEVAQARLAIEPEAAFMAAEYGTEDDIANIEKQIAKMEGAIKNKRVFEEADVDFHLAIIDACHNRFFHNFSIVLKQTLQYSVKYTHEIRDAASFSDRAQEHKKVYIHIANRDSQAAWDAMRAMLASDLQRIMR